MRMDCCRAEDETDGMDVDPGALTARELNIRATFGPNTAYIFDYLVVNIWGSRND